LANEIPFLRLGARRWRREQCDIDDLVQETLVRALAGQHLWEPGTNLKAWLNTLMRNHFINSTRDRVVPSEDAERLRDAQHLDEHVLDGPVARLMLRDLDLAMQRLPEVQRTALRLVAIDEKSYEEAAEIMNVSEDAVRAHLVRARASLRQMINSPKKKSVPVEPVMTPAIVARMKMAELLAEWSKPRA
jgi:RNA polymerase sigma-70 factor (ECF subfamily)